MTRFFFYGLVAGCLSVLACGDDDAALDATDVATDAETATDSATGETSAMSMELLMRVTSAS